MRIRGLLAGALAATLLTSLAACGGGDGEDAGPEQPVVPVNPAGAGQLQSATLLGSIAATDVSTVAAAMRTPNTGVLRAETVYTYRTPFQKMLPGTFTFRHKMDLSPRAGVPITFTP